MKKAELIEILVEAGYDEKELESLKKAELEDLYKKEQTEEPEAVAEVEEEEESAEPQSGQLTVVDSLRGDKVIRVYSKERHGKDYKKLAEQFITKFPHCNLV